MAREQVRSIILQLNKVTKNFNGMKTLDSITINVNKGEITAIIGPNGSGKTTMFNLISGFQKPDSGRIFFNDKNITFLPPWTISKKGIARTFQLIRIFPMLTVIENILLALEQPSKESVFFGINPFVKYRSDNLEKVAIMLLSKAELLNKKDELSKSLSHGQSRLLEILRTIALDAKLYMFDEPMAGVFPEIRQRIVKMFRELQSSGKTVIFIEHNMEVVKEVAERVIVVNAGKVIADGIPSEVLCLPEVLTAYFGESIVA